MTASERKWRALVARNLSLAGMPADTAGMLQQKADAPLRPSKPQLPADVGLFGDDHLQLDLVEMLQDPTNE
jgi:hypothetical protein